MVATFLIAAVVGVVIGLFSGMLGVGGGSMMVPIFRLAFGLGPLVSTATSLFTIIPTSISGTVTHLRRKTCVPKLGVAMGLGGAITSPAGVWLAQVSPNGLVMVVTATIIAWSGFTMLQKALASPRTPLVRAADAKATSAAASTSTAHAKPEPAEHPSFSGKQLALGVFIGAVAGVASGYVGLGGGFLMVPLMAALLNMPMKLTSGTSLIAIMILAMPAVVAQCLLGNVDYLVGIGTACGAIIGAYLGARQVTYIPERTLRFIFAAFLGVAAVMLVARELGLLG